MLDEEILELRRKLDESITKEKDYNKTYRLSIELDDLITKYYNKKLMKIPNKSIWKEYKDNWRWIKTSSIIFFNMSKILQKNIFQTKLYKKINNMLKWKKQNLAKSWNKGKNML